MEEKTFNVDKFIKMMSVILKNRKNNNIETEDLIRYCKFTTRYIQKWAKKNNIEYKRVHGRKYYIWNKESLLKFAEWHNKEKIKKPRKKYYIPKEKIYKPKKIIRTIDFPTIKSFINDLYDRNIYKFNHILGEDSKKSIIRHAQKYCKDNNVPFELCFGRKYYKIDENVKNEIIKKLDLDYHIRQRKS